MNTLLFAIFTVLAVLGPVNDEKPPYDESEAWEHSVVHLDVTQKRFDYFQPWFTQTGNVQKPGVVVSNHEILTTAQYLNSLILVRVQKEGKGRWWNARVVWVDYHANLALLTVDDEAFWEDLKPVRLADPMPIRGTLRILRWRDGKLEGLNAEINRIGCGDNPVGYVKHLTLDLTSTLDSGGWSEIVTCQDKLVGITCGQLQNHFSVIPSAFIAPILKARKEGKYPGLGCFDFAWQSGENPSNLQFLRQIGKPCGVIVTQVPAMARKDHSLKAHDVILEVQGHSIDIQGYYKDPRYGYLSFQELATRGNWAGDTLRFKIWRDGGIHQIDYVLPPADAAAKLTMDTEPDQDPEYLIAGGLVFQPLRVSYYRGWDAAWINNEPNRLFHYNFEEPNPECSGVVILTGVFPDVFSMGYQNQRLLPVERVNGKRICNIAEIHDALQHPVDGFHIIEFHKGKELQRIVLDAAQLADATGRVLQRYGIQHESLFHKPKPSRSP